MLICQGEEKDYMDNQSLIPPFSRYLNDTPSFLRNWPVGGSIHLLTWPYHVRIGICRQPSEGSGPDPDPGPRLWSSSVVLLVDQGRAFHQQ